MRERIGYTVPMSNPDHRPAEVREQAQRNAERARAAMEDRRSGQGGGLSGWVAERAGRWDLSGQDETTLQRQKYLWNVLVDYWFRMEIDGWENIPEPPVLLVGIHSGAPFVWDAWTVGLQWWRRFGQERPLHGTAHDALMAIPVIGRYFRSMGVLPAAPDAIATALAEGRDVALWPGGEVDSLRPWIERDQANLAGRKGFVKMAIRAGVPVVPMATVGGADAMPVLIRGDKLSKALRLDRVLRLKVFPLAISLPWGIAPAALPQLPLPAKIRTRFMPAVELDHDPARAEDEAYVDRKYSEIQDAIQDGMDALARKRAFPLFG
ncbi:glycerol acyltransferase [Mycobacterium sp. E3251]|uniref:lysophospholipid acyltransferase family protein n=1 Tax=unclassified Mycobacterium TaxID=2642494 RepID=UPI0007FD811A|nr:MULTISPECIES: lysophospholipid acyltransferase family protein [unclassified Mycobacterium]OBG97086.1 glycerol acyltransferase [Mycobacterium sp. E3251]OBI38354.1 glycerol acyltransferase [Mycobacterium sp. E1386]